MGSFFSLSVTEGVGVVRLDRPPANAIDVEVASELQAVVHEAAERDDVATLVVWGGPSTFAAGADIRAMVDLGPQEVRPVVGALGDALDALAAVPKVSIAAIHGYALGGGFELALACDLRYLADDGTVGLPEIRIGVMPGAGGTQRLTALVGPGRARELVFTGRHVAADEALALGLVERVEPSSRLLGAALEDARALAAGPRRALAAAKRSIALAGEMPAAEALRGERDAFVELFGTPDQREGMRAFLEKRQPRFEGLR